MEPASSTIRSSSICATRPSRTSSTIRARPPTRGSSATGRVGFPTVAIRSEFHAPLSYGDVAVVELTVLDIGSSSVKIGYDVRRERDGVLCFNADITTVFVGLDSMKSTPITDDLREVLERYLTD